MAGGFTGGLVKGIVLGAAALAALSLVTPQPDAGRDTAEALAPARDTASTLPAAADGVVAPAPSVADERKDAPAVMPVTADPNARDAAAATKPGVSGDAAQVQVDADTPATDVSPTEEPAPTEAAPTSDEAGGDEAATDAPATGEPDPMAEPEPLNATDLEASDDGATQEAGIPAITAPLDGVPSGETDTAIAAHLPLKLLDPPVVAALTAASPPPVAVTPPSADAPAPAPAAAGIDTAAPDPDPQADAATDDQPPPALVIPTFQPTIDGAPPDLSSPAAVAGDPPANNRGASKAASSIDLSLPPDLFGLSASQGQ